MTPSDNSFTSLRHNLALLHSTLLHSYPVPLIRTSGKTKVCLCRKGEKFDEIENRRNCSTSELHGSSLFRIFNSYSFNLNGWLYVSAVPAFVCGELPAGASSFCEKNDLLRFHRIFLLFDPSKPLFFYRCA